MSGNAFRSSEKSCSRAAFQSPVRAVTRSGAMPSRSIHFPAPASREARYPGSRSARTSPLLFSWGSTRAVRRNTAPAARR